MAEDKVCYAYYDCQICGKEHKVKAVWNKECEVEVGKLFGIIWQDEVWDAFLDTAKKYFEERHPGAVFDPVNLVRVEGANA